MEKKLSASDLHSQFENEIQSFEQKSWHIAIFEGSPSGNLYSWCPDCVVASTHVSNFEKYQDKVKLLKFKVGARREWESKTKLNPFKDKFPHLSDVPTAILFMGKLEVLRVVAPQESDLRYMCERVELYKRQIKEGKWHPPLRFRK